MKGLVTICTKKREGGKKTVPKLYLFSPMTERAVVRLGRRSRKEKVQLVRRGTSKVDVIGALPNPVRDERSDAVARRVRRAALAREERLRARVIVVPRGRECRGAVVDDVCDDADDGVEGVWGGLGGGDCGVWGEDGEGGSVELDEGLFTRAVFPAVRLDVSDRMTAAPQEEK